MKAIITLCLALSLTACGGGSSDSLTEAAVDNTDRTPPSTPITPFTPVQEPTAAPEPTVDPVPAEPVPPLPPVIVVPEPAPTPIPTVVVTLEQALVTANTETWDCGDRLLTFEATQYGEGLVDDNGLVSFNFYWELIPNGVTVDLYVDANRQSFYLSNVVLTQDYTGIPESVLYQFTADQGVVCNKTGG